MYEVLSDAEASLQYVAMALSTATLGATNNDVQLMNKSQQAYGLAMQQMATSFISPSRNKDGILAAIQLMRVYEVRQLITLLSKDTDSLIAIIRNWHFGSPKELARIANQGFQKAYRWGDCSHFKSRTGRFMVCHGKTAPCGWSSNFGKSHLICCLTS